MKHSPTPPIILIALTLSLLPSKAYSQAILDFQIKLPDKTSHNLRTFSSLLNTEKSIFLYWPEENGKPASKVPLTIITLCQTEFQTAIIINGNTLYNHNGLSKQTNFPKLQIGKSSQKIQFSESGEEFIQKKQTFYILQSYPPQTLQIQIKLYEGYTTLFQSEIIYKALAPLSPQMKQVLYHPQKSLHALYQKFSHAHKKLQQLQQTLQTLLQKKQTNFRKKVQQILTLQQTLQAKEKKLQQLQTKTKHLQTKLKKLQDIQQDLKFTSQTLAEWKRKYFQLQKEYSNLQYENQELQTQLQQLQQLTHSLSKKLKKLSPFPAKAQQLQQTLQTKQNQLQKLQQQVQKLTQKLTLTFQNDNFEPNNSLLQAKQLLDPYKKQIQLSLKLSPIDEDWFKIQLQESSKLSVQLTYFSSELDVLLYNQQRKLLSLQKNADKVSTRKTISFSKILKPGTYYLRILLDRTSPYFQPKNIEYQLKLARKFATPHIPGFVYLRTRQYSCGGKSYSIHEYEHLKTGLEFALLPGGYFLMGSPSNEKGRKYYEGPQRKVHVQPFLISKTEVTQRVWKKIMGTNPSYNQSHPNLPVEQVSLEDALKFCQFTNLQLPTEAQWEYAARAGTNTAFFWGNSTQKASQYCWFTKNTSSTQPVAQKLPNAFGLYDMLGNVREWCIDPWHPTYKGAPTDARAWMGGSLLYRVNRGGGFASKLLNCRSARRYKSRYDRISFMIGFRVVYPLPKNNF
ncbi:MAG: hypothetical protein D6805_04715 [Planctomycetota bacterium]|nr:MAG: hypothetical protein D6805_04715 [Planctomycetota bacterium]